MYWQLLIEVDKIANAATGGRRDITISARIGASLERGCACRTARALAYVLDWCEPDHCRNMWELYRATRKADTIF